VLVPLKCAQQGFAARVQGVALAKVEKLDRLRNGYAGRLQLSPAPMPVMWFGGCLVTGWCWKRYLCYQKKALHALHIRVGVPF